MTISWVKLSLNDKYYGGSTNSLCLILSFVVSLSHFWIIFNIFRWHLSHLNIIQYHHSVCVRFLIICYKYIVQSHVRDFFRNQKSWTNSEHSQWHTNYKYRIQQIPVGHLRDIRRIFIVNREMTTFTFPSRRSNMPSIYEIDWIIIICETDDGNFLQNRYSISRTRTSTLCHSMAARGMPEHWMSGMDMTIFSFRINNLFKMNLWYFSFNEPRG